MKKLLIGLLFSICGVSHAITYQSVRASTSTALTPSIQTGTMNLSSGTVTNLNSTNEGTQNLTVRYGVNAATGVFSGAVTAGSFSPASALPSGSTQYIQNQVSGTQANSGFNVSTGTISSGTITSANITNATIETSTITTLTGTNVGISSMTTTLPMSGRKITGLANGATATDAATYGQVAIFQVKMGTETTGATVNSASFVNCGSSVTITPSSASNRVKIVINGTYLMTSTGAQAAMGISRAGNDIFTTSNSPLILTTGTANIKLPYFLTWIDSPATTSATVYQTRCATSAGNIQVGGGAATGSTTVIIVEEVQ